MKKKANRNVVKFLWKVRVRHRDWLLSVNSLGGETYMKQTTLFIVVAQPKNSEPCISKAMARARVFVNRNKRLYGLANIRGIDLDGNLDE